MKGDQRIPYTIELDATLTVIAEYADMTAVDHVAEGRATQPQETSPSAARRSPWHAGPRTKWM